jgi:hypothetical protein
MVTVMDTAIKTTVLIREDLHSAVVRRRGKRAISDTVNEALERLLAEDRKSMFGSAPWLDTSDIRDEDEPHEDL